MSRFRRPPAASRQPVWGFTLIELMVVVAIIVMALGVMAPSLLEYFRNQKLKNVRSHFSSALTIGRLVAITERSPVRVVFFREGARVYNVHNRAFRRDEEFNPESAPGSAQGITFNLRFARQGGLPNSELLAYRDWEKDPKQSHLNEPPGAANPKAGQCDVDDLPGVEFQRDGSVRWLKGSDVPTSLYKKDPPMDADIIVEQSGNSQAIYIDVRSTGSIQSQLAQALEVK
jgi:type IV fimbrial biogenesis protein FimU